MTKVKICGLKRMCDIEYVNKVKPDFIGFVFFEKSKRYVSFENAKLLKSKLDKCIKAVGVFVNEDINIILKFIENNIIDVVQLHGNESNEYIKQLKSKIKVPVIKAFKVECKQDVKIAEMSFADIILLDNGNGGTGKAFDWSLIQNISRPFFLAGGLDCNNVSEAIKLCHPYGVDTSSGVETDGVKDKEKIYKFLDTIRNDII